MRGWRSAMNFLPRKDQWLAVAPVLITSFFIIAIEQYNISREAILAEVLRSESSPVITKTDNIRLTAGSTITALLQGLGVNIRDAKNVHEACYKALAKKIFKAGQEIEVTYEVDSNLGSTKLLEISFYPTVEEQIIAKLQNDGKIQIEKKKIPLLKETRYFHGNIQSNFFASAKKNGVPNVVVNTAVSTLSYMVNFQHGIKAGAPFELLCEVYKDQSGKVIKTGNLLYVSLKTGDQYKVIYALADDHGKINYYSQDGESVIRSLLQTPLDPKSMRVTSKFSNSRMHPIRGYNCAHRGVDFGAKKGTPVMSAGDGIVVKACYFGGYGNYVRVKHSNNYETVYAHLSKFGSGIRPGVRVSQRQILGYVGSTGTATGAHLHHEVIFNNRHMDPQKVITMPKTKLSGSQLKKFIQTKTQVEQVLKTNRSAVS